MEDSRSRGFIGCVIAVAAISTGSVAIGREPSPESARLRKHVEILASPEFQGRRGKAAEKSRRYLVDAFREMKLEPLFDGSYTQDIPAKEPNARIGANVGAKLVGSDPKLRDEWIILAAHFDHLGERGGVIYPGADDNATAVAMMLESARCFTETGAAPRRSVMFIGFDLEEFGLFGSRYFVEHSPVPMDKIALFVTADMIGRSLGGVCAKHVFVMGTEHAPELRTILRSRPNPWGLNIACLGADVLLVDRSDYGPFRSRKVPFLFFSTGENPCYHTPEDVAETIDHPKHEAISRIMHEVVKDVANRAERPKRRLEPDNPLEEALAVRDVFRIFLESKETMKIGVAPELLMRNSLKQLDEIAKRGAITPQERATLIRVAQVILASVL